MNVKIATAPCSWGVWYADGTPSETPAQLFLDQAQQAGYQALELGPDGYLPEDRETLERELSRRGLEVAAGTACYRFDQYEKFADFRPVVEKLCARIASMGGKYLVTMDESDVGLYSEKKADYTPALWNKYLTMFREMGEFAQREFGLMMVYHPHIKSLIETEGEIVRLLDATGLNLCFDTGHHAYVNGNGQFGDPSVPDFIHRYAERIKYLHFKQVDGEVLALIGRFAEKRTAVLSLNENEALVTARAIGLAAEDLAAVGETLRERFGITEVLIHTLRESLLYTPRGITRQATRFIASPKISTGAGDHFNAAACLGAVLGLTDEERVALSNRFSSLYVETGTTPSLDALGL